MLSLLRALGRSQGGSTAIEYAVIASLVAIASVTAFRVLGGRIQSTLSNVANTLG